MSDLDNLPMSEDDDIQDSVAAMQYEQIKQDVVEIFEERFAVTAADIGGLKTSNTRLEQRFDQLEQRFDQLEQSVQHGFHEMMQMLGKSSEPLSPKTEANVSATPVRPPKPPRQSAAKLSPPIPPVKQQEEVKVASAPAASESKVSNVDSEHNIEPTAATPVKGRRISSEFVVNKRASDKSKIVMPPSMFKRVATRRGSGPNAGDSTSPLSSSDSSVQIKKTTVSTSKSVSVPEPSSAPVIVYSEKVIPDHLKLQLIEEKDKEPKILVKDIVRILDAQKLYNIQTKSGDKELTQYVSEKVFKACYNHEKLEKSVASTFLTNWRSMLTIPDDALLEMLRNKVRVESEDQWEAVIMENCIIPVREDCLKSLGYHKFTFPQANLILEKFQNVDALLTEGASKKQLACHPPDMFVSLTVKSKVFTFLTCFGIENGLAWVHKMGVKALKAMKTLDEFYVAFQELNEEYASMSRKSYLADHSANPPMPTKLAFKQATDKIHQSKFKEGQEQNLSRLPTPSVPTANDPRSSFQRRHEYPKLNQLETEPFFLMDQRDLSNEYLREDAQQTKDENLYYVQEAKRDPSRANVFQSKLDNRDHSAQPCFDAMGDKGCLMSKKSPPCPYNHDHKVFTAYQDAKFIAGNWNKWLSPHLHNKNIPNSSSGRLHFLDHMEQPPVPAPALPSVPTVISPDPQVLQMQVVHQPYLKQSPSSRFDSQSSHQHGSNGHRYEDSDLKQN